MAIVPIQPGRGRLGTALRLRCPRCGVGPLFPTRPSGANERVSLRQRFRMHTSCPNCRFVFEREAGYFLGAIYFNYFFTIGLVAVEVLLLGLVAGAGGPVLIAVGTVTTLLVPILFYRWSLALWLALDHYVDPPGRS